MSHAQIKLGLEIHVQLNTGKLFCQCDSVRGGDKSSSFSRRLWAVSGEMGLTDRAVSYEKDRARVFQYEITDNSCLVEMDEDPPHPINKDALLVALRVALALKSDILDHLTVMRKIVVDGSNTAGFQRTSLVALGGHVETSRGPVKILTICIEEDSARRVSEDGKKVLYSLDRLGIPLLEIATGPDIKDEAHAVEVAREISFLVASSGHFRSSAEAIRQDVNLSLGYGRVEIKGVSKLSLISDGARNEINRQLSLAKAMEALKNNIGTESIEIKFVDCSATFVGTESKLVSKELENGRKAFCSLLKGMNGLLRKGDLRIGKEIADLVKLFGIRGLLHSDELPGYGIGSRETDSIKKILAPAANDAFMIVLCNDAQVKTLEKEIKERLTKLLSLDFSETRSVSEDGTTYFLRPLPGGERMYPETDIPNVDLVNMIAEAMDLGPIDSLSTAAEKLQKEYDISAQDSSVLVREFKVNEFRELTAIGQDARLSARMLLQTIPELENHKGKIEFENIANIFRYARENGLKRESIEVMLGLIASGQSIEQVIKDPGILPLSEAELKKILSEIEDGLKPGQIIAKIRKLTKRPIDTEVLQRLLK